MTRLNNSHVIAYVDGIARTIGEIYVDTADELPTKNGIDGYELIQGSVAYVIKAGKFYVMGGDGLWYSTNGEVIS